MTQGTALLPPLVIRADARPQVGAGHIMRCLALAQQWRQLGGKVIMLTETMPEQMVEPLMRIDICCERVTEISLVGTRQGIVESHQINQLLDGQLHWLVIDGYGFSAEYIQAMARPQRYMLLINDGQWPDSESQTLPIHIIWGPLFSNPLQPNHLNPQTHLRGLSFAMIRSEFIAARTQPKITASEAVAAKPLRCLVSLGGTVPQLVWRQLLRAFAPNLHENISLDLVMGSANALSDEVEQWLQQQPGKHRCHVWPSDWATLMSQADCAISAAGGTLLELAALGVPTLAGAIADNQRLGGKELSRLGMIDYIGDLPVEDEPMLISRIRRLWNNSAWRDQLSEVAQKQVDGRGAARVAAGMRWGQFGLRPATTDDSYQLWQLRNDVDVRANAFNTGEVKLPEHEAWLAKKLLDPNSRLWVAETPFGEWMGQTRWDLDLVHQTAIFSFAIVPAARGWGLASRLIQKAIDRVRGEFSGLTLQAFVKPHNRASQSAFLRVGFVQQTETLYELCPKSNIV